MHASNPGPRSLQDVIDRVPNLVDYLYNNPTGARVYPVVLPEYTNWRDEQRAWRESVCLFDLSYHMSDLYVSGPDAFRLLESLAINSFRGFEPGRAKQMITTSPDGYVVGDVILFYLAPERFQLVGRPSTHNWVEYQAQAGGYRVTLERDEWSVSDPNRSRRMFRYQLQGPNAPALLEKLNGGPLPPIKFFHIGQITVAGQPVNFLSHGMVGVEGGEIFGPYELGPRIKEAILQAGQEFGLRHVGARAYASNGLESGWIPSELPAIYTGSALKAYREWLPANAYEAVGSLGGSFRSTRIEDYYLTPWDLGYGHILKLDHDFVGRAALEEKARQPHRQKVTLVWHPEDVKQVMSSWLSPGEAGKYIELPVSQYATWMYDRVEAKDGSLIGYAMWTGYTQNERAMLSLAVLDEAHAAPGTEVTLVWGEPDGGSRKPSVEPHKQMAIRCTVGPAPYAEPTRRYRGTVRKA